MLTPREKAIAGFAYAAGVHGLSMISMIEVTERAEAEHSFEEPKLSDARELAREVLRRRNKDRGPKTGLRFWRRGGNN